jgi:hypothetical protein
VKALQIHAGPRALARLRVEGLRPEQVAVVPAAAGGPKGLVLNHLDRYLFGQFLPQSSQTVHLLGASIGAWRMASACMSEPEAAFEQLAQDYIGQRYEHAPGKPPRASHISTVFGRTLNERLGPAAAAILTHPRFRLHVLTSRGRHMLSRGGRWATPAGYLGAYVTNAASRRALGVWLERVLFSDPRTPLPFPLDDFRTRQVPLGVHNLPGTVLASCSIPLWLDPVLDIPGGPRGAYWDGGITDYHLHLRYSAMTEGLVLYPHFQAQVIPGWLDKAWKRRHRASPWLDNLVLLSPQPQWVAGLPGGKLPDRDDFKTYANDLPRRDRVWRQAVAESARLAEELAEFVARPQLSLVQTLV